MKRNKSIIKEIFLFLTLITLNSNSNSQENILFKEFLNVSFTKANPTNELWAILKTQTDKEIVQ